MTIEPGDAENAAIFYGTGPDEALLFVYGTLKRGDCRHDLLRDGVFLGEVLTTETYRLFDCGNYPAMVWDRNGMTIKGELYRIPVSLFPRLDAEEGVESGLYARQPVTLQRIPTGVQVMTYVYLQETGTLTEISPEWKVPNS